jgi:tetratricopeptide (TPR) repeat protein
MVWTFERKAKPVKSNTRLVLSTSLAALSLGACSTMTMPVTAQDVPRISQAGTYLAANFAAAQGDVKSASAFYANSLKDDPDNEDLLERTFLFAAESGEIDRAIALTDRVIATDPDNRPAHLVRQVGALMKKDYAAVTMDLAKPAPGPFAALSNRVIAAWALAGARDFDGALDTIDGLSMQRGVEGLRLMHRALILDYAGRNEEAENAYRLALGGMGAGPRAADAYGRFLMRKGRTDDAKRLYERVLSENAGNPVAQNALRDIASKRPVGPAVTSPAEGVAEALFAIAASLTDQRSADVAILYLNLTLYLRPDFDLARVLLASRYESMERYELANGLYNGIRPSSPYYGMTQMQSAINDGRVGHPETGIQKLRRLAASQPKETDIWIALGDLLRSSDQYADAAVAYDKAIQTTPEGDRRLVGLLYARGVARERSNRWDDAENDFRAALKINPDRADVLNYLGYSWVDKGLHLDEAVTMLEKARALRPLDGFIADSVGWAYYKLGRFPEAARTLEEAVQLAPAAPDINDHLGDAYWRVGRKIDARFQWQHALQLDPESKEKAAIERKLQFGLQAVAVSGP